MTSIGTIDALGTHCPVPVRLLARAAARRREGSAVELLADDPLTEIDVPAWCHAHGHQLVSMSSDGEVRTYVVRFGPASASTG